MIATAAARLLGGRGAQRGRVVLVMLKAPRMVVCFDESRHTANAVCPFWAIGSLWLPRSRQQAWTTRSLDKGAP
jgi:hypothetical protein